MLKLKKFFRFSMVGGLTHITTTGNNQMTNQIKKSQILNKKARKN